MKRGEIRDDGIGGPRRDKLRHLPRPYECTELSLKTQYIPIEILLAHGGRGGERENIAFCAEEQAGLRLISPGGIKSGRNAGEGAGGGGHVRAENRRWPRKSEGKPGDSLKSAIVRHGSSWFSHSVMLRRDWPAERK